MESKGKEQLKIMAEQTPLENEIFPDQPHTKENADPVVEKIEPKRTLFGNGSEVELTDRELNSWLKNVTKADLLLVKVIYIIAYLL